MQSSDNNSKPSPSGKARAGLFFAVTFFFWFSNYAYIPTLTPYLTSISIGYSAIGTIAGAYGLAQLILRIPLGVLTDRLGKRKLFIIAGTFFGALSSFLLLFSENAALIIAFRFLSGVSATMWVVFTILFSSYFDEKQIASRISLLSLAQGLGMLSAKMAGSLAVGIAGYRAAFTLSGIFGLVGFILSFFVTENVPAARERPGVRDLLGVVRDRNLIVMSVLTVFSQMVMFATTNTFTPEIAVSLGAGATELGYLATVSSLPAMFAAMLLGWLFRRRVNFKALIAISFILQIAGTLLSARAWSMAALYAASLILNFGTAICFTSLLSHCTLTIPAEKRGGAMGFFAAVYSIGMYGGPVLIGVLADAFGMVGGFTLFTAVPIIGLALTLALIKRADA